MSGDVMSFPSNWWTFVQQYQFADKDEVYTNGSMLIPSFRVRQMVEHYFGGEVGKTSRYAELFGTPERAANTVLALQICPMSKDECEEFCPAHDVCFEFYKDGRTVYEMAEWLRGDA